jgi:hypothetical protein
MAESAACNRLFNGGKHCSKHQIAWPPSPCGAKHGKSLYQVGPDCQHAPEIASHPKSVIKAVDANNMPPQRLKMQQAATQNGWRPKADI